MNAENIALASIFVTGLVSILGILIPAWLSYQKSNRERSAVEIERIHAKAERLSSSLAKLRNLDFLKAQDGVEEALIELRAHHDAWEMAVFSKLTENERNEIREMRRSKYGLGSLSGNDESGTANVMNLIDTVVELSCAAIGRLTSST